MRLAIFEDQCADGFGALAFTRPVFELLCGHYSLRERLFRQFPVTEWGAFLRPHLVQVYREQHPEAKLNDFAWLQREATLLVHGRWLPDANPFAGWQPHQAGFVGETPVLMTLEPDEVPLLQQGDWERSLQLLARDRQHVPIPGILAERPWHLVNRNPAQITADFQLDDLSSTREFSSHVALQGNAAQVSIHPTAELDPYVVLDARKGPITLAAGVIVQAFTRIEGPCFIGAGTQLFRANVRGGTSIGPMCRVGGEVEASVLQGYVNKYHDGFLGHSFVGEWVNLGAETTNSDLKLDYSNVKVALQGRPVSTGSMKVGCFLGDHTKTGIGTLLNTGTATGVMCVLLPGGLLPRYVPSFTTVTNGEFSQSVPFDRLLHAAATAMERRGKPFTTPQERLFRDLHQLTRREREETFARQPSVGHQSGLQIPQR